MIHPKKSLGQHFLQDENIAKKIVSYLNPEYPVVLEIGPGMGILSKYLLEHIDSFQLDGRDASQCVSTFDPWFMEVDREAVEYLKVAFPGISPRLITGDFLKYDLAGFPPVHVTIPLPKFTVIGNFPFNISSQILFKVLANRDRIPEVVGMFQKEVAERIASPPGNKTYGIISVLLQAFYDIEYLFTVNETVFYPPPKVKSAVIRLRRNKTEKLECDEALFTKLVKTAFNQRRKTLRNSIRSLLPATINVSESTTPSGSATPSGSPTLTGYLDLRAERLSVEDFIRLASEISTFA